MDEQVIQLIGTTIGTEMISGMVPDTTQHLNIRNGLIENDEAGFTFIIVNTIVEHQRFVFEKARGRDLGYMIFL